MKNIKFLFWLLALIPMLNNAQLNVSNSLGNNALIQTLAGPGVVISNVNIVGANGSFGQFSNGGNVGIAQGVLLTSGQITNAVGPNIQSGIGTDNGAGGSSLIPGTTFDACTVTFDIVPQGNTINFSYVFGSDEYHEYVNSDYNDAFRFFIQGPGINGMQNMATLNNGTTVAINNINNGLTQACQSTGPGMNANFFVDNCGGASTEYDGFTTVLTARANVQACQRYKITMVIADVADGIYDSGVFIQAGTITSNTQVAFHFEHQNGTTDTNFNSCENIFLDGSATTNTGSYYLDIWQVNPNNPPTWLADQGGNNGWVNGSPTLINVNQTFPTVNFQLGVTYEVKLAINGPCGWVETTRQFTITSNTQVAFHFEHQNGTTDTNFNSCENIFIDGSATTNTGSYYLDIWKVNPNNTLTWLANQGGNNGWVNGSPTLINVNQTFPTVNFQLGMTYEVKLAINGPCGWVDTTRRFTITSAGISSLFNITGYNCHDGVYDVSVSAQDTNPYQWWGLYETSVEGSILDQDTIFPIVAQQSFVNTHTFTGLNPYKFYYIKHGVWTDNCGWQETRTPVKRNCCTDNPYIVAYCANPCDLDSFPIRVLDKDGNPITLLSGAIFQWTNSTTGATSNSDIVTASEFETWTLVLKLPGGCIYKMSYRLVCCEADIHLEIYKCPTAEDLEVLYSQLRSQKDSIDKKSYEKFSNYISSQNNLSDSRGEDCDPCESGIVVIRVVDGNGNLVTNFISITWNDGLAANSNVRFGYVNTTYTATIKVFAANGKDICTYTDDIIYNCVQEPCPELTAPTNLHVGGIIGTSLFWDPVPSAAYYTVSSQPAGGHEIDCKCSTPISMSPISTTNNVLALPQGLVDKCFLWRVTAFCADGSSATSEPACYNGSSGSDGGHSFKILPNPSNGIFTINLEGISEGTITITDIIGLTIYNTNFKSQSDFDINIQDKPRGIYIVKVTSGKEILTGKIIKE